MIIRGYEADIGLIYYGPKMVMGRNGYGPKWSWAEMVMGRNDPESNSVVRLITESNILGIRHGPPDYT